MNKTRQRIPNSIAACMLAVALVFDLLQLGAKLLALMGVTALGGILATLVCYNAGVEGATGLGICAGVGAAIGAGAQVAATLTGVGAAAVAHIGILMEWLASAFIMLAGYAALLCWFWLRGVSVLTGKHAAKKITMSLIGVVVSAIPLINGVPDITSWTLTMIIASRLEDKADHTAEEPEYNGKNLTRVQRRYVPAEV